MRILVAEDDPTSRLILTTVLKKIGHDVVETSNGRAALEVLCESRAPRLAIMDWMMPELSGEEVCRQIRAIPTTDPPYLILLTGKEDEESVVKGLDAGANDYLKKPYRGNELRARIGVGERMLELQADLNAAKDALHYEATHDALTGALNRRAIVAALQRELVRARASGVPLTLGLGDIDVFKQINDRFGHQVGDDVLKAFTLVVQDNLREGDLLGRYGGEEFIILLPGSKAGDQEAIFERIRAKVAEIPVAVAGGVYSFTVSIGSAHSGQADSVDALLALADAALYEAKRGGRNRVCYAKDPER